jgi:hypothetical protein
MTALLFQEVQQQFTLGRVARASIMPLRRHPAKTGVLAADLGSRPGTFRVRPCGAIRSAQTS